MAKKNGRRSPAEKQVELLRAIWTEMKALNSRVDQTNERLEAGRAELKAELTTVRSEVKGEVDARRMVESEVRLATATTQLSSDVQSLSGLIRDWREEHRLEEHAGFRSDQ